MNSKKMKSAAALGAIAALGAAANAQDTVYAVTDNQTLVTWDANDPTNLLSGTAISGLAANESVRGIDFRPATGELYAVGSFNNLYRIDTSSGNASLVGGGSFAPGMNGSSFGFDFNPVIDRIRLVGDVNQNLVLNPNDGTSTQVTDLFYGSGDINEGTDPNVVASAYTNSFFGAASTQLYGIDTGLDILVTQANSAGTLMTVGDLGVDMNDTATFDISGLTGVAYGTIVETQTSRSLFWTMDLSTGQSTVLGEVGGGSVITAMTTIPAPGGLAALGLGCTALTRRKC